MTRSAARTDAKIVVPISISVSIFLGRPAPHLLGPHPPSFSNAASRETKFGKNGTFCVIFERPLPLRPTVSGFLVLWMDNSKRGAIDATLPLRLRMRVDGCGRYRYLASIAIKVIFEGFI